MDKREDLSLNNIIAKLEKLGLEFPQVPKPLAAYVPFRISENQIYTSGALPLKQGKLLYAGSLGKDLDVEKGKEAAKIALLNGLAYLHSALETLEKGSGFKRLKQIVQLTGYVQSQGEFYEQHLVLNGASELLPELFFDIGHHSRIAIGCSALPLNAPVEIALIANFE